MEQVIGLYSQQYDEDFPVICFDERPCFLIGDVVAGLAMQAHKPKREHYSYTKNGSASVLAAIEPKTGKRLAHIRFKRNKISFAKFMKNLTELYPKAKKIKVVLDNLNTHNASAFYEAFDAITATQIMDKIEFIYTPKSASWLNMIEIEFSALARQCLNRRIPTMDILAKEVITYFKERTEKKVTLSWKFDRNTAREKLSRHYINVNNDNQKILTNF